jgi:RNA polymerase sigma-70 factor (ECF subfamily)
MRDGPTVGLDAIEHLLARGELTDYLWAHSARADLYRRNGQLHEAKAAYERALTLATQAPERRFLERRLARLALS